MKSKPTVLLDVDGVIADFCSAALTLVSEFTGHAYKPEQVTTWEVFDSLDESPEMKEKVYCALKGKGGCSSILPYPRARAGVQRLGAIARVVAVTSPFKGSETWAHEREVWLEKHFGGLIDHVIHAHHKAHVHGDFFIDDKPAHLKSWLDYWVHSGRDPNCKALLWESDRTLKEPTEAPTVRVGDWSGAVAFIKTHWRKT